MADLPCTFDGGLCFLQGKVRFDHQHVDAAPAQRLRLFGVGRHSLSILDWAERFEQQAERPHRSADQRASTGCFARQLHRAPVELGRLIGIARLFQAEACSAKSAGQDHI